MICRLCLTETPVYSLLKVVQNEENEKDPKEIAGIIGKHLNLPLDIDSDIICNVCWQQIKEFHHFYLFIDEKQEEQRNGATPVKTSCKQQMCRLCFDATEMFLLLKLIKNEENEEQPQDIAAVIGKHFDLRLDVNTDVICQVCWQQTNEFHKFYLHVAEKQKEWANRHMLTAISEGNTALKGKPFVKYEMDIQQECSDNSFSQFSTLVTEVKLEDVKCYVPTPIDESKLLATQKKNSNKDADNHSNESKLTVIDSSWSNATPAKTASALKLEMEDVAADEMEIKSEFQIDVNVPEITESSFSQWNKKISLSDTSEMSKNIQTTNSLGTHVSSGKTSSILKNRMLQLKKRYLDQYVKRIKSNMLIGKHGVFKCDLCEQKLESFEELKQHFKVEHKRLGYVSCCNRRHFGRDCYAEHIAEHLNLNLWKCKTKKNSRNQRKNVQSTSEFVSSSATTNYEATAHSVAESLKYQCHFCSKKFRSSNALYHHLRYYHKGEKFTCDQCNTVYKNLRSLKSHIRQIHNRNAKFKCDICDLDFKNSTCVKNHKVNAHNVAESWNFECSLCPRKFPVKHMLNTHMRRIHAHQSLTCKECNKECKSSTDLYEHQKEVHNQNFGVECELCGRWFSNRANCNSHKTRVHVTEGINFQCPFCPNNFLLELRLAKHIRDSHSDQYLTCDECNKKYKTFKSLTTHKNVVHLRVYETECDICGKRFSDRSHCKAHQARVHKKAESWDFPCLKCPKKFAFWHMLKHHMRVKHKNDEKDERLPCDESLCNKEFPNREALMRHKWNIHLRNNATECDICGKRYAHKRYLKAHKANVHKLADSWDFECTLCPMKFPFNFLLKAHVRDRHKKNPFTCVECNKEYNSLSSLSRHKRRNH